MGGWAGVVCGGVGELSTSTPVRPAARRRAQQRYGWACVHVWAEFSECACVRDAVCTWMDGWLCGFEESQSITHVEDWRL